MINHMNTGVVKYFNDIKGFGYIETEVNGEKVQVFVHYSSIQGDGFKTLYENQVVKFDIIEGPRGLQAVNVFKS